MIYKLTLKTNMKIYDNVKSEILTLFDVLANINPAVNNKPVCLVNPGV